MNILNTFLIIAAVVLGGVGVLNGRVALIQHDWKKLLQALLAVTVAVALGLYLYWGDGCTTNPI